MVVLLPFIYMAGAYLALKLIFGVPDLSAFDWAAGVCALFFYFTVPTQLHDKVLKISETLGKDSEPKAIRLSRLIRNYVVSSAPFFIIQPFLTTMLGSSGIAIIPELAIEFFAVGLICTSGLYAARFYDLMEKQPEKS